MSSRNNILEAIRKAKPALHPLPSSIGFASAYPDLAAQFSTVLQNIGGTCVLVNTYAEITAYIAEHYDTSRPVISLVDQVPVGNVSAAITDDPHGFENLYLTVLQGQSGVAENGAIWMDESNFTLRALPFISLNLAVIIAEESIVGNMHEAYQTLTMRTGFGSFIAGPSKTADIEQSLVIGAHGPKSMLVFIVRKSR